MIARVWRKLSQALALLRGGPGRLDELERQVCALQPQAAGPVVGSVVGPVFGVADATAAREATRAIEQLQTLLEQHDARAHALEQRIDELTRGLATRAADQEVRHLRESLIFDLRREADWLRDHLTALGAQVDRLAAARAPGATGAAAAFPHTPSITAAEAAFYPALEKHFRGTREELQSRLGVYRRWIDAAPAGAVADIGCGRGEWLELLASWGREAQGVDTNALLVAQGRERGLAMHQADAVAWLSQQADASLAVITSFHVVEHLPFGVLLSLVEQARRALKPGGLLVLETPNPENLIVASHTFWTDPTHQRPIPPSLLDFIVLHGGFEVVEVPRLNPPEEASLPPAAEGALRNLLARGRDYAVIGRKPSA